MSNLLAHTYDGHAFARLWDCEDLTELSGARPTTRMACHRSLKCAAAGACRTAWPVDTDPSKPLGPCWFCKHKSTECSYATLTILPPDTPHDSQASTVSIDFAKTTGRAEHADPAGPTTPVEPTGATKGVTPGGRSKERRSAVSGRKRARSLDISPSSASTSSPRAARRPRTHAKTWRRNASLAAHLDLSSLSREESTYWAAYNNLILARAGVATEPIEMEKVMADPADEWLRLHKSIQPKALRHELFLASPIPTSINTIPSYGEVVVGTAVAFSAMNRDGSPIFSVMLSGYRYEPSAMVLDMIPQRFHDPSRFSDPLNPGPVSGPTLDPAGRNDPGCVAMTIARQGPHPREDCPATWQEARDAKDAPCFHRLWADVCNGPDVQRPRLGTLLEYAPPAKLTDRTYGWFPDIVIGSRHGVVFSISYASYQALLDFAIPLRGRSLAGWCYWASLDCKPNRLVIPECLADSKMTIDEGRAVWQRWWCEGKRWVLGWVAGPTLTPSVFVADTEAKSIQCQLDPKHRLMRILLSIFGAAYTVVPGHRDQPMFVIDMAAVEDDCLSYGGNSILERRAGETVNDCEARHTHMAAGKVAAIRRWQQELYKHAGED